MKYLIADSSRHTSRWRGLGAGVVGLTFVLLMHTEGPFIQARWLLYLLWAMPACLFMLWFRDRENRPSEDKVDPFLLAGLVLFACTLVYLLSSATRQTGFYFLRWPPRDGFDLTESQVARFFLLSALLTPLFLLKKPKPWLIILVALLLSQYECVRQILQETGGRPIYRDDHPSFMLRLALLAKSFPQYVYYNPFWNGGFVSPHVLATGTVGIGTLLWPLFSHLPVHSGYTGAVAGIFVVLLPFVAVLAVRLVEGRATACWCAGLFALGVSRFYFKWLLHFGTLGACFSLPMVLLMGACLYRTLWLGKTGVAAGAVLVLSSLVFVMWPPGGLMVLPCLLAFGASAKQWTRKKLVYLGLCGCVVVLAFLPYFIALLKYSRIAKFVQVDQGMPALVTLIKHGWRVLSEQLYQGHPLLLFMGILGAWFSKERGVRVFYGSLILGFLLLVGWGEVFKPHFGFSRAAIPLLFTAIVPASLWLGAMLETTTWKWAPVRSAIVVLLLLGAVNVSKLYGNRGVAKYQTRSAYMRDMVDWIREETTEDARILFAGPTVHAYGGGHVAYLPVETGREMMACDFYHFSPKLVEYEYPPRPWRASREGLRAFMDLYNVSHVITYHGNWIRALRAYQEDYEEVAKFGDNRVFVAFKVNRKPDWFLENAGTVEADVNRLTVRLDDPDRRAVLKYNWAEQLRVTSPVTVAPFDAGHGIQLIDVEPHGEREFTISFNAWR